MKMLTLHNVTLCTLGSAKYEKAHREAIEKSCQYIEFGSVQNIIQECNSIDEWNRAIVYDLWKYIPTEFALLIHPDGYIIHPELWNDEWLRYDYIGAPWPLPQDDFSYRDEAGDLVRVGNSVGLRSKKLLKLPTELNLEWKSYHGFLNEDGFFCCNNKKLFEKHGCKFAPLEVAVHFSKEHEIPENIGLETFMFHQV